jgi:site-specific DNA-cytosine methylase
MVEIHFYAEMTMRIIDLFAGKGGEMRRVEIEKRGHEYVTLDIGSEFGCDITADIFDMTAEALGYADFVWASVPCEAFSVASISHHWSFDGTTYVPKTKHAKYSMRLVVRTLRLIRDLKKINPELAWLCENPRGMLRKMAFMQNLPRSTVTYCQYGDSRMKPTDLWGVVPGWEPRPTCNNGDSCHAAAPRGSRTGTQGIKGAADRSVVPLELWSSVLNALESHLFWEGRS